MHLAAEARGPSHQTADGERAGQREDAKPRGHEGLSTKLHQPWGAGEAHEQVWKADRAATMSDLPDT